MTISLYYNLNIVQTKHVYQNKQDNYICPLVLNEVLFTFAVDVISDLPSFLSVKMRETRPYFESVLQSVHWEQLLI